MSLLYKPAGAEHSNVYSTDGALSFIVESMTTSELYQGFERLAPQNGVGAFVHSALRLYAAFRSRSPEALVICEEMALRLSQLGTSRFAGAQVDTAPMWLRALADRIRALCTEPLSLAHLATELDVHPVYLARVFRRHYACSIGDYMLRCRIDLAVRALATTQRDVSEIGVDLGFADQSHFTRRFRRETGTSPCSFRRLGRSLVAGPST